MGNLQGEKRTYLETSHVEEIVYKLKFRIKLCFMSTVWHVILAELRGFGGGGRGER